MEHDWMCKSCGSTAYSMMSSQPLAKIFCDDCNYLEYLYIHLPEHIKQSFTKSSPEECIAVHEILPTPFDWVNIAESKTLLRSSSDDSYLTANINCIFAVPHFTIAKLPITVAQFAVFSGQPFDESKATQPVSDITWFEATKFCEWLSEETGLFITLPTEPQWQLAMETTLLNIGMNPVSEWCLTEWGTGVDDPNNESTSARVVRSVAEYFGVNQKNTPVRRSALPHSISPTIGFRVCTSPQLSRS